MALAQPERDLWMLDDGSTHCLALYEDLTRRTISTTAIAFYRLVVDALDIASFAAMFRSSHQETEWTHQKWSDFQRLLEGAPSAPYGVPLGRDCPNGAEAPHPGRELGHSSTQAAPCWPRSDVHSPPLRTPLFHQARFSRASCVNHEKWCWAERRKSGSAASPTSDHRRAPGRTS